MRNILISSIVIALCGCASEAMTPTAATKYASLNLTQYLAIRFSDKQSRKIPHGHLYEAYFNGVNYRQLERPSGEVDALCQAQSGSLRLQTKYAGDPTGRYIEDPLVWAQNFGRAQERVNQTLGWAAAEVGYEQAQRFNQLFRTTEAREAYMKALASGAFGLFECLDSAPPKNSKWSVAIMPAGMTLKDPMNDLSNNMMLILVLVVE